MAPPRNRRPGQPLPKGHRTCTVDGCGNNAKQGGVCIRHGAVVAAAKPCQIDGCASRAKRGGLCLRHGGKLPPCSVVGCANDANTVDGYCVKHGGRQKCSTEGCENLAKKGGVCCRHGAQPKPICRVDGCTTLSYTRGVCIKHGAKKYVYVCSYGDCQSRPKLRGVCKKHIDEWRVCNHDGCEHIARKGGACTRHNPKKGSPAEQAIRVDEKATAGNAGKMAEKVGLLMHGGGASIGLAQSDGLCQTISEEKDVTAEDAANLLVKLQHGNTASVGLAESDELCRTVSEEPANDVMPPIPRKKRTPPTEQGASLNETSVRQRSGSFANSRSRSVGINIILEL